MSIQVPFFRPQVGEAEIAEVVDTLRSGWLTSGPKVTRFEQEFAARVGASHAVAVNSCTAALHLAVEALNLRPNQAVLVPTMTFAATAEIVRYQGAFPLLVDCDPQTGNMNMEDAARKLERLRAGEFRDMYGTNAEVTAVGIIPVHVGGLMMDTDALLGFAAEHGLWVVEDAAHAFPAACRSDEQSRWQTCGEATASVSCFSFYANKTITTGEGGMATTDDAHLAARMRSMSLHGLSHDAWQRYSGGGSWDYQIIAPGYKYNLTDIAAAIGIHQLARADEMRKEREKIAEYYLEQLADTEELELPVTNANRIHAWHLFPIRLRLERLTISRNKFIEELKQRGVGCSVHWRPLHLHPYYRETFGWRPEDFPSATKMWERLVSLPIFPGMRQDELAHVVSTVKSLCARNSKAVARTFLEEASVAIS
ncbi:MAG TPA: DegT/DnrJ/EryC1/StrS family aminotransferase [Pyrinomonadaceae bacterium]|nr:DegT/DnrJ/EryC1/StrS family aminotransferase [Pyrinomonadaceae bacterium]